jgi:hypothetical protein
MSESQLQTCSCLNTTVCVDALETLLPGSRPLCQVLDH